MAGHLVLVQGIGVRIPVSEPKSCLEWQPASSAGPPMRRGHLVLVQGIGVRIPVSEPDK